MTSFFEKIFSTITAAIISVVASFGLVSTPVQPQENVNVKPTPIIQTQPTTTKEIHINADENKKDSVIGSLKKQIEELTQKVSQPKKEEQSKTSIVSLPNGAVVEMDDGGNVIKTIKEVPQVSLNSVTQSSSQNTSASSPQNQIGITSVKVTPSLKSANFEWETNIPTDAKVFISSFNLPTAVHQSNSENSTHHVASASSLKANTSYAFEIETVSGSLVKKYSGSFKTISMASLEIISPLDGKGLGKRFDSTGKEVGFRVCETYPEPQDETQYVYIGLIVRDDEGNPMNNTRVEVTATDEKQNKTMDSTGNVTPIYDNNGSKVVAPYYPFRYIFTKSGNHTITFKSNGMETSVTLAVTE